MRCTGRARAAACRSRRTGGSRRCAAAVVPHTRLLGQLSAASAWRERLRERSNLISGECRSLKSPGAESAPTELRAHHHPLTSARRVDSSTLYILHLSVLTSQSDSDPSS
jgi:hypothetical protein